MLPTTLRPNGVANLSTPDYFSTYFRRLSRPDQMDFEYTFWLMVQLCISPKTAYRHLSYHHQTKHHWARDDPAFVVICCQLAAVASLAFGVMFGRTVWQTLALMLSAVLVHFLAVGCGVATLGWLIANKFLLRRSSGAGPSNRPKVEWLYAFDVHCNAYLPLFLTLYVAQLLLSPLLLLHSWLTAALSNALFAGALSYYHYLNFLGYSALPFLEGTEVFLWPIGAILLLWPVVTVVGFNPTRFVLNLYFGH